MAGVIINILNLKVGFYFGVGLGDHIVYIFCYRV